MPKAAKVSRAQPNAVPDNAPTTSGRLEKLRNRRTELRTELRYFIDSKYALIVGDDFAGLWYTIEDYAETNVIFYGCKVIGWPSWIPFRNLSDVGGFAPATDLDKLQASLDPTLVAPGKGFVHRKNSGGRNDIGRSRYRWKTMPEGGALRRPKDGPKSSKVVESDDEDDAQVNTRPLRLQPLPLFPPFAPGSFSVASSSGATREEPESEIEDLHSH